MFWIYVILALLAALAVIVAALIIAIRLLSAREPYASFLKLRLKHKAAFFKLLITDRRVPWYVKAIPFFLVIYLASPIDLIPDFIPVLGQLDDLGVVLAALWLMVRLVPRTAVDSLIAEAAGLQVPSDKEDED